VFCQSGEWLVFLGPDPCCCILYWSLFRSHYRLHCVCVPPPRVLPNIKDGYELGSVMDQCMFLAARCAQFGAEFRRTCTALLCSFPRKLLGQLSKYSAAQVMGINPGGISPRLCAHMLSSAHLQNVPFLERTIYGRFHLYMRC
jgi:hypothetical protein